MIRYIPLSYEDTGYRFAFWDTVTDCFLTANREQAWFSRGDLLECLQMDEAHPDFQERLLSLIPEDME